MKKIIFLGMAIIPCITFLLTWCKESKETNNIIANNQTNMSYTGENLTLYPFWIDNKISDPDYSRMTIQKLYNDPSILNDSWTNFWKDIYFLNYEIISSTWTYIYQEWPSKSPIYFDWLPLDKYGHWFTKLEWNLLVTWYLETNFRWICRYCSEEEMQQSPQIEIWSIKSDNKENNFIKRLSLWYTARNVDSFLWEDDSESIISLSKDKRIENISHFYNGDNNFINLRDIANDWKIHTFHIIIKNYESEWDDFWSWIIERRLLK